MLRAALLITAATISTMSATAGELTAIDLVPVVTDFAAVDIGHLGDGSGRLVLATTEGRLWTVEEGKLANRPLLDISDRVVCCGESGFAAFAFHPDFPERDEAFLLYTRTGDQLGPAKDSVLSRVRVSPQSPLLGEVREEILLRIREPASNHNANDLEFGPDGMLYVSTGDGGGQEDPFQTGQDGTLLNGKILRLHPDGTEPYAVPPDNPFVDDPDVLDEIWALGLRNPWRMSFDEEGNLWIGDAGQERWEEVNSIPQGSLGLNFGWSEMEGPECFTPGCAPSDFEAPTLAYCHAPVADCPFIDDCAIVGVRRYRGHRSPGLADRLVFVDFCSGRVRVAAWDGVDWNVEFVQETGETLLTLGEGEDGELYVSSFDTVYRLQAQPAGFHDGFESGELSAWSGVVPDFQLPIRNPN
ncbi:MAG: PQQ-dependent sugar dehydrogenase [Thermoanaerobaculia bacterium]|nr:PQQ-dependent sugar dehydrogenase [Thermoanaerobaculia bacterium]